MTNAPIDFQGGMKGSVWIGMVQGIFMLFGTFVAIIQVSCRIVCM